MVAGTGNRIVLVKRNIPPKIGQWCLPGGFIELGETPEQGAIRELFEETGLSGRIETLLGVRHAPSDQYHSVLMVGYRVTQFGGTLTPGDDASDVQWFQMDTLPPLAFDSHHHFVEEHRKRITGSSPARNVSS